MGSTWKLAILARPHLMAPHPVLPHISSSVQSFYTGLLHPTSLYDDLHDHPFAIAWSTLAATPSLPLSSRLSDARSSWLCLRLSSLRAGSGKTAIATPVCTACRCKLSCLFCGRCGMLRGLPWTSLHGRPAHAASGGLERAAVTSSRVATSGWPSYSMDLGAIWKNCLVACRCGCYEDI